MPENPIINDEQNTITYNVVLDPGDIARQAEEIRNQLDLALGVGSNAGAQFINTADVINPQFATLPQPDFTGIQGQFSGTFDQSFWERAQGQITGAYQDVSSGLDRMQQDLSMMVNRASNFVQNFQPSAQGAPYNPYEDMLPDSFGEYLLASVGFGGDIKGPIAPSVYQRYGRERLSEGIQDVFQNPGEAISDVTESWAGAGPLGLASYIGAHFIPGYGQALTAIETVGLADEWLSGAYNKREDLAGGIQEIARQQFGTISKEEARGLSQNVLDFVNSYQGYAQEYDIGEVSANILQFANEGGFSNTRNVEQMQQWIQTVTEETRQIARNLGVFQDEAVSIMAELAQKSMVSSENMRDISEQMRFYGGVLKQDPVQLLQGAVNTAEQFRQAGMYTSPETAMQTYIDANVEAQRLIQSNDPFVQSSMYRMGGPQGVAQGLIGMYGTFQNSTMGGFITMNQSVGGTGGYINETIQGLGNNYQNINDYSWYLGRGREEALKNQGLLESQFNFVEMLASTYSQINGGQVPTWEHLEGFAQIQGMNQLIGNLTPDQIRMAVQTVRRTTEDITSGRNPEDAIRYGKIFSAMQTAGENTETTTMGELAANTIRYVDELGRDVSYGYGKVKKDAVDFLFESNTNRIDKFGNRSYEYTLSGDIIDQTFDVLGAAFTNPFNMFAAAGDLDIIKKASEYSIQTEFESEFIRNQVRAGRYSMVGQEAENMVRTDMEDRALEYLRKQGIKISDRKDLNKTENQKILKDAKLDEASIKAAQDSMWGVDSTLTADEKYAMKMWQNTPVFANKEEQYYTTEIENYLENNMDKLKDDQGNFLSLEEIVEKLDKEIEAPKEGMPEHVRRQLIFQASDNQKNKEFQDKMISEREAKTRGRKTWDLIEEGDVLREKTFEKMEDKYNLSISQERGALGRIISADKKFGLEKEQLRYEGAIQQALDYIQNPENGIQGSPDQLQNIVMAKAQEFYDAGLAADRERYGANWKHVTWAEAKLDDTLREQLFTGEGGKAFENLTTSISGKSALGPQRAIFGAVTEAVGKVRDREGLDLNVGDITATLYNILPQVGADGKPIDIKDLSDAQIKETARLISSIRSGDQNITLERAQNLENLFKLKEGSITDSLGYKDIIKNQDNEEMGTHVKHSRWILNDMRDLMIQQYRKKPTTWKTTEEEE